MFNRFVCVLLTSKQLRERQFSGEMGFIPAFSVQNECRQTI